MTNTSPTTPETDAAARGRRIDTMQNFCASVAFQYLPEPRKQAIVEQLAKEMAEHYQWFVPELTSH